MTKSQTSNSDDIIRALLDLKVLIINSFDQIDKRFDRIDAILDRVIKQPDTEQHTQLPQNQLS